MQRTFVVVVACLAMISCAVATERDQLSTNVVDKSKWGVPLTISLERNTMTHRRAHALKHLKQRQKHYAMLETSTSSGSSTKEIPLDEEILSEKHLATYFGTISIRDTNFRVLFDTGSCEFWVPSMQCTTSRCMRHSRLPLLHGRVAAKTPMNIQYLSGRVQGDMFHEDVVLGDITVKNQIVGAAKVVDIELLDDVKWDGILGLAYPNPTLTARGITPIFDTILKSHVLSDRKLANQFAYFIDDSRGAVTFGGANCDLIAKGKDKKECVKQFQFIPITEKTYWTVTLHDVKVQYPGQPIRGGYCGLGGCKAIVDTGTYLIYGPQQQVGNMLTRELKTCADYTQMPDFIFEFFGGVGKPLISLKLRPIDYILKFELHNTKECVMGVSPDKDTIWTLGQVFLRSFYTVFDRDEDRIGFARLPRTSFRAINAKKTDPSFLSERENIYSAWDRISDF